MRHPQPESDRGHSSTPAHHKRVDSTHESSSHPTTLHSTKQDQEIREHQDRGVSSMVHHHLAPVSDRLHSGPHPSPQNALSQSSIHGRSMPQVTYDKYRHDSTLRVVNTAPTEPSRTVREVWALYGEPGVKPRKIDRSFQSQHLQVVNPDKPQSALDHQQSMDSRCADIIRLGPKTATDLEPAQSVGTIYSLQRTVSESFELVRRGSGRRATFRRGFQALFGINNY